MTELTHPFMPNSVTDRRTFIKTLSAASLGVATFGAPVLAAATAASTSERKRYVIVGVGSRHQMYQDAIERDYPQHAELVGICDTNAGRLEEARNRSTRNGAKPPVAFLAEKFDEMLAQTKPDQVIVTTV